MRAVPRELREVGADAGADLEHVLARVAGELHHLVHPRAVVVVAVALDLQEPLERVRLRVLHVVGAAGVVVPLVLDLVLVGVAGGERACGAASDDEGGPRGAMPDCSAANGAGGAATWCAHEYSSSAAWRALRAERRARGPGARSRYATAATNSSTSPGRHSTARWFVTAGGVGAEVRGPRARATAPRRSARGRSRRCRRPSPCTRRAWSASRRTGCRPCGCCAARRRGRTP